MLQDHYTNGSMTPSINSGYKLPSNNQLDSVKVCTFNNYVLCRWHVCLPSSNWMLRSPEIVKEREETSRSDKDMASFNFVVQNMEITDTLTLLVKGCRRTLQVMGGGVGLL